MTFEQRLGRPLALAGLVFILLATLRPLPGGEAAAATTAFWCLVCGNRGTIDVTLNIILFVPFALGLGLAGQPRRRVVAVSVLLTLFVEFMQLGTVPGRDASLSDLLTNTTGGVIGASMASQVRTLLLPGTRLAATLVVGWAAFWLSVLAATAWLLQPWAPKGGLRVGWGPNVPGYGQFSGRVTAARADGIPLYPGRIADSVGLRSRVVRGDLALQVAAVVAVPNADWSPIVALLGRLGPIAGVYEEEHDLILELPTNANRFRLRTPALRLMGGRPPGRGEPLRLTAGIRERTLWITSAYGGERRHRELTLSPTFGWVLLLPWEYAFGPRVEFLTALWIGGLLLPLGYWARRMRSARLPRARVLLGLGVLLVVGLAVLPWLTGYPPSPASEWLAGVAGLATGWALASRATYLEGRCASPSTSESYLS